MNNEQIKKPKIQYVDNRVATKKKTNYLIYNVTRLYVVLATLYGHIFFSIHLLHPNLISSKSTLPLSCRRSFFSNLSFG